MGMSIVSLLLLTRKLMRINTLNELISCKYDIIHKMILQKNSGAFLMLVIDT